MSVSISVSNLRQTNCNHILKQMMDCNIDCRVIETTSVVENKLEQGCLITVDKFYNTKLIERYGKDYEVKN